MKSGKRKAQTMVSNIGRCWYISTISYPAFRYLIWY